MSDTLDDTDLEKPAPALQSLSGLAPPEQPSFGGLYGGAPIDSVSEEAVAPSLVAPTAGQVAGATAAEAFAKMPSVAGVRALTQEDTQLGVLPTDEFGRPLNYGQDTPPEQPMPKGIANKQFGIPGVLSFDHDVSPSVAQDLYEHHIAEIQRNDILQRNHGGLLQGGLARFITGGAVSLLDPLSLAAAFVPGVPEARIAGLLGDAAQGAGGRLAVRALTGASQGAAGMVALQPLEFAADREQQDDWDMGSALSSVAFGGLLGGVLHAGIGAVSDINTNGAFIEPPLAEGYVRFYHGGSNPTTGGARFVSPDIDYAEGYARKNNGQVHYVDIPEDSSLLIKAFDDTGSDVRAPFQNFEAPEDIAKNMRMLQRGAALPAWSQRIASQPPEVQDAMFRGGVSALADDRPLDVAPTVDVHDALAAPENLRDTTAYRGLPEEKPGVTAYHGTPYDIDNFDVDKIGTGEGAQAYGHGLYFAENERIASFYRDTVTGPPLLDAWHAQLDAISSEIVTVSRRLASGDLAPGRASEGKDAEVAAAQQRSRDLVAEYKSLASQQPEMYRAKGNLYTVKLNVSPDELLDWDAPLSEQTEPVQQLARDYYAARNEKFAKRKLGKEFYKDITRDAGVGGRIGGIKATSEYLQSRGLKGVQYDDAASRYKDGRGTHNFVIFDNNDVQITHLNGEPLRPPADAANQIVNSQRPQPTAEQVATARGNAANVAAAPVISGTLDKIEQDIASAEALEAKLDDLIKGEKAAGRWTAADDEALKRFDENVKLADGDAKAYAEAAACLATNMVRNG